MKFVSAKSGLSMLRFILCLAVVVCSCVRGVIAQESMSKAVPVTTNSSGPRGFDTPEQAADALVTAAETFDVVTLIQLFGPDGEDVVLTGEVALDRQHAMNFAAQANEHKKVTVDPKSGTRAFLLVGSEDWPFPVPLVKKNQKWFFEASAGRQELLYRRIGSNELDAIQICNGYVEAQQEYALQKREGYEVNQYAQRIISTAGKQDGLAWQNPDGSWGGPIGEGVAKALAQGYSNRSQPYHGYFFKILKGQGPDAPLGRLNYVIEGVM